MYIYCKGLCHVCQNPLDIFVKCRNYETKELIRKYRKIRPIWLHNNYKYYKFFGLKVKNVCNYCFKNFKKPSISELKGREIGKGNQYISYSLTKEDILLWYIGLKSYVSKNFHNREILVYNDI
tara:strand:+ start:427 stop:795 length:369 start_codon:yes stop_codon:yes gene_type:complete